MSISSQFQTPDGRPGMQPIPALAEGLAQQSGPIRLMYDPTVRTPLRLRDPSGKRLEEAAHTDIAARLAALDTAVGPLTVAFVRARLIPGMPPAARLDLWRLRGGLTLLLAQAPQLPPLDDIPLIVRAGLRRLPPDGGTCDVDVNLEVAVGDEPAIDRETAAAVEVFSRGATRVWALCVREILAQWVIASGIDELRLAGRIRPRAGARPDGAAPQPTIH